MSSPSSINTPDGLLRIGFDALNDGIALIGRDGKISFWNAALARMSSTSPDIAIGSSFEALFPDQNGGRLITAINWALNNGLPSVLSTTLNRRPLPLLLNGHEIKQSIYVTPLASHEGESGCLICIRDVTALVEKDLLLRTRAQELQDSLETIAQARDAAESANHAKSAFLANISHELRTPLHAILGFSDVLRRDSTIGARQLETLAIIHKSGNHLLGLINDVLEIAKIEAGKVELQPAPFDLSALVDDVVEMLRIRAEEKGITLLMDASAGYPHHIVGDEAKIREILINLLSNAIKATDTGQVTLHINADNQNKEHLTIEVEDTGCGIHPEDQARILEPFVQVENQRKQQGTGLGLAITRQFVDLMGGTLSLSSSPGQGSTFRVEFDVALAAPEDITPPPRAQGEVIRLSPGQNTCRVLVVEDQPENRHLLTTLLEGAGFLVRPANNGAEAVQTFAEWQPNFIWMDWRLPILDGIKATHQIRSMTGGNQVRIVVVTASIFKEDDEQLANAGFDGIVHKPFYPEQIFEVMERLLGVRYERAQSGTNHQPQSELTVDAMVSLPVPLRNQLAHALELLDGDGITQAVNAIASLDPELGMTLRKKTRQYDYPAILAALRTTPNLDTPDTKQLGGKAAP
jgi:signal transduction histidine kinase/DNA-binding NarL/FixJ family response regulator